MSTETRFLRVLTVLLALASSALPVAAQSDGALDTSFWFDGKAVLDSPPGTYVSVDAVVTAPGGNLVAVGTRNDAGGEETLFWAVLNDGGMGTPCVAKDQSTSPS